MSRRLLSALAAAVGLDKQTEPSAGANQRDDVTEFDPNPPAPGSSFAGLDEWSLGDAALFGTGPHATDRDILGRLAAGALAKDLASCANRDLLEQILSDGAGHLPGEKNVYYVVDRTDVEQYADLLASKINPAKRPFHTNYWEASAYAAMGGGPADEWAIAVAHVPEDFGPLLYGSDVGHGGSSRLYVDGDALEAFNRGIVGHIVPSASLSNCWRTSSLARP